MSGEEIVAVDFRLPNPRCLKREFRELIRKKEARLKGEGEKRKRKDGLAGWRPGVEVGSPLGAAGETGWPE
jgi:hypothetical protein